MSSGGRDYKAEYASAKATLDELHRKHGALLTAMDSANAQLAAMAADAGAAAEYTQELERRCAEQERENHNLRAEHDRLTHKIFILMREKASLLEERRQRADLEARIDAEHATFQHVRETLSARESENDRLRFLFRDLQRQNSNLSASLSTSEALSVSMKDVAPIVEELEALRKTHRKLEEEHNALLLQRQETRMTLPATTPPDLSFLVEENALLRVFVNAHNQTDAIEEALAAVRTQARLLKMTAEAEAAEARMEAERRADVAEVAKARAEEDLRMVEVEWEAEKVTHKLEVMGLQSELEALKRRVISLDHGSPPS